MSRQATTLMKELEGGLWTVSDFRAMTRAHLGAFATWNGPAARLPKEYEQVLKEKPFTRADQELALSVYEIHESKSVSHNRPETHLSTQGGHYEYSPDTVAYYRLNGERVVRSNAPIPAKYNEKDSYSNLQAVAAFCAQQVVSDKGEWKISLQVEPLLKVCSMSELNVPGLRTVAEKVKEILSEDPVWTGLPLVARNAVTGEEHLCFVREAIGRLPIDAYDILNTLIVCKALKTFHKVGEKWAYMKKDDGQRMIPESVYMQRPGKDVAPKTLQWLKRHFPGCYWYLGGLIPRVVFPDNEGTLESTLKNKTRAAEVQGSSTSPTVLLAQMKDYSGLTDDFGKRIQWLLGTSLGVWRLHRSVNIVLKTVGDIPILVSSLNKWSKYIREQRPKMFLLATDQGLQVSPCSFAFVLPMVTDRNKVNVKYHPWLINKLQTDAVVIQHHEASLPTAATKGTKVDYDKASENIVPAFLRNEEDNSTDYVMYTAIYGACPFGKDPEVEVQMSSSLTRMNYWKDKPFVFWFGNSGFFHGVVSSLSAFVMVGWGYPKKDSGYDMKDGNTMVELPLLLCPSQREWYMKVVRDARVQSFSWLNPLTRYSPISNLACLSKAGVTLTLLQVEGEKGGLIGNYAQVASRTQKIFKEEFVQDDDDEFSDVEEEKVEKKGKEKFRKEKPDYPRKEQEKEEEKEKAAEDEDPVSDDEKDAKNELLTGEELEVLDINDF